MQPNTVTTLRCMAGLCPSRYCRVPCRQSRCVPGPFPSLALCPCSLTGGLPPTSGSDAWPTAHCLACV